MRVPCSATVHSRRVSEKSIGRFVLHAVVRGALVVAPLYLAILLLLKAAQTVAGLVRPFARLLPDWVPAEQALSILLVLAAFFAIGVGMRTQRGQAMSERVEKSLFQRIPGYAVMRSLTQQLADDSDGNAWRPALIEIEDALVPGFIIEEVEGDRYTVLVPSVPTPLAGAVYVLDRERVHPLDVPFAQAIRAISQWGSGSKDLVAAMQSEGGAPRR
jgi:uncharacterized membrane protein